MGLLRFLLLCGLPQVWGSVEGSGNLHWTPVLTGNFTFRVLQISSFANSSWMRTDFAAYLDDVQTHSWHNDTNDIRSLQPWSRGHLSQQEWENLVLLFKVYRISVKRDIVEFVKMLRLIYPVEFQLTAGCEVHSGGISEHFLNVAYQGDKIISFQTSWEPAPGAPSWVQTASKVLNQDEGTKQSLEWLFNDVCPQFVRGLIQAGKSDLEKQEKPEAWLSRGPSPGPDRLLLVCHVSGFYPKPVWVMWMQGEQEEPATQRSDVLPNADGTWYLQVTLNVEIGETAGLSCRVKHSSLGGRDIVLSWDDRSPVSVALIIFAVLVSALLITSLLCLIRKRRRCSYDGA
ncbi:PREDICTED: antigen-presenting glycoprotein CD1d-like [Elephantulus edwardii]|uniref:antigen-presenting glycoprotein CD1d-like n=1 Tax=Elephantulus edwardii TaxID=28737 RepID=UPI0003F09477|nr:PREDICTED: antigen-presenting glycoprotein CD1d-like [Elephantulus edwardii]